MTDTNVVPFEAGRSPAGGATEHADNDALRREAIKAARTVIDALMTPGVRFPSREALEQAWVLLQEADEPSPRRHRSGSLGG